MVKRSSIKQLEKFELELYSHIKKHESIPSYKKLGISKSTLSYHCKKLKRKNLVFNLGSGVWKINKKNTGSIKAVTTPDNTSICRLHNIQTTTRIKGFSSWHLIRYSLKKRNIPFDLTKDNKIKLNIAGCNVHLTKISIVVYFPSGWNFVSSTGVECEILALERSFDVLEEVRKYIGVDFRYKGEYLTNITRRHLERVNDGFAKRLQDKGEKLWIKDKFGKVWCITDRSFNMNNIEFIDNKEATRDNDDVYAPFMNKLRANPDILDSLDAGMGKMLSLFEKQQEVIKALVNEKEKEKSIQRWIR